MENQRCETKNDFLPQMATASPLSVSIFDVPQKSATSSHCSHEWSQHDTCCNEHDLRLFYELEASLIDLNHKYLSKVVTDAAGLTGRSENFKDFQQDSMTCWNHMKKVRGSALCSICSGRSEYFIKGGKALISPDTCMEAVTACNRFFKDLSDLAKFLPKYMESESFGKLSRDHRTKLVDLSSELKVYSPPQDLVQAFEQIDGSKKDEKSKIAASLKVCSMVLNVRKTPYVLMWNKEGVSHFLRLRENQIKRETKEYLEKLSQEIEMNKAQLKKETQENLKELDQAHKELQAKNENKNSIDSKTKNFKYKMASTMVKANFNQKKAGYDIADIFKNQAAAANGKEKKDQAIEDGKKLESNWEKEMELKKNSVERNLGLDATNGGNLFTSDTLVLVPTDSMLFPTDVVKSTSSLEEAQGFYKPMNMSLAFP